MSTCQTKAWTSSFLVWPLVESNLSTFKIYLSPLSLNSLGDSLIRYGLKWINVDQIKQEPHFLIGRSAFILLVESPEEFCIFIKTLEWGLYIGISKPATSYWTTTWTQKFQILVWPEYLEEMRFRPIHTKWLEHSKDTYIPDDFYPPLLVDWTYISMLFCSGYMSPEYAAEGLFSVKSDVFSFGVLVLEIVSGKKNWRFSHPDHDHNLLGHVRVENNT